MDKSSPKSSSFLVPSNSKNKRNLFMLQLLEKVPSGFCLLGFHCLPLSLIVLFIQCNLFGCIFLKLIIGSLEQKHPNLDTTIAKIQTQIRVSNFELTVTKTDTKRRNIKVQKHI